MRRSSSGLTASTPWLSRAGSRRGVAAAIPSSRIPPQPTRKPVGSLELAVHRLRVGIWSGRPAQQQGNLLDPDGRILDTVRGSFVRLAATPCSVPIVGRATATLILVHQAKETDAPPPKPMLSQAPEGWGARLLPSLTRLDVTVSTPVARSYPRTRRSLDHRRRCRIHLRSLTSRLLVLPL